MVSLLAHFAVTSRMWRTYYALLPAGPAVAGTVNVIEVPAAWDPAMEAGLAGTIC